MPNSVKEWAMLIAKVSVAYAAVYAFQKNVTVLPVVGAYLPGGQ